MQNKYLDNIIKTNVSVSIYLMNGVKLAGFIDSYDSEIIILKDQKNSVYQLIYKHSISTIVPTKSLMNHQLS